MKKFMFYGFGGIFFSLLSSCTAEQKSDAENLGFIGNVKSITSVTYDVFDKFGEGNLQKAKPDYAMVYISSFDSLGNLLVDKCISFSEVKREYTTIKNEKGQWKKWISYDDEDDSKMRYGENYYYDEKGSLIREIDLKDNDVTNYINTYNTEGKLISQIGGSYKKYWEYANGELVKYTEWFYDMKNEFFYKNGRIYKDIRGTDTNWIHSYDEFGRDYESEMYQNDNLCKKVKYFYLGKTDTAPIEKIIWDSDGVISSDITYTYFVVKNDTVTMFQYDKGELEQIEFFLRDSQDVIEETYKTTSYVLYEFEYVYDNGKLTLMKDKREGKENKYVDDILTIYEDDEDEIKETKYERYNQVSRIIKDKNGKLKYSYVVDGNDRKKTITISDNGETKKGENYFENGKLVKMIDPYSGLTTDISYNEAGFASEMKSSDGTVLTYKYEYDSVGNWIKSTEFKNGKAIHITERSIIYY